MASSLLEGSDRVVGRGHGLSRPALLFCDLNIPSAFNATLDALVRWTLFRVRLQRSVQFVATALWNRESVMKANPGNFQYTIDVLDVTFNIRHEILS